MYTLVFVSGNKEKVQIIKNILQMPIEHVNLSVPEVQSLDVEKVCIYKAKAAYDILHKPVIVEDSGFYIDAWNGLPGPFVRHFLETVGNAGLCKMMSTESNRLVKVKSAFAILDKEKNIEKVISSELAGIVPVEPRGVNGFGWDPIFQPEDSKKTFGEMTFEEKSKYSIRKRILLNLHGFLIEKGLID